MKPFKKNTEKGLTIIQLMVILFFAGLIGKFVADYIIDKRCESEPPNAACKASRTNK